MADDSEDKTEAPTGKRLTDARDKGQVLQSREVISFVMLGASTLVMLYLGPAMMEKVLRLARSFLERPHELLIGSDGLKQLMIEIIMGVGLTLMVPLGIIYIAILAAHILQFGFNFSVSALSMQLSRISVVAGFKRLFSSNSIFETLKSIIKLSLVGAIGLLMIVPIFQMIDPLMQMEAGPMIEQLRSEIAYLMYAILAAIALLAVGDFLWQRYQYMKKMRMTRQEIKDEHKQMEGDPLIRNRLRKLRMQKARNRMMQAVPTATVVITNPTHISVALRYEGDMLAPMVVAKGEDFVALKIREVATLNQVPIVENPPVARLLYANVEVDQEIHPDHYKAVAEIISFILKMKNRAVGGNQGRTPVGQPLPPKENDEGDAAAGNG